MILRYHLAKSGVLTEHDLFQFMAQHNASCLTIGVQGSKLGHPDTQPSGQVLKLAGLHSAISGLSTRAPTQATIFCDFIFLEVEVAVEDSGVVARLTLLFEDGSRDGFEVMLFTLSLDH